MNHTAATDSPELVKLDRLGSLTHQLIAALQARPRADQALLSTVELNLCQLHNYLRSIERKTR